MAKSPGEWREYEDRYGMTISTLIDLRRIQQAEREIAQCEGCRGLPCKKAANQFKMPVVDKAASNLVSWQICKWDKVRLMRKASRLAKIPDKYDGKTLKDYRVTEDNRRAVGLAQQYIRDKPPKGLFFFGSYGTGKTFLAALIAKAFIGAGKSVIFGDMPELLDELRRTFDSKDISEAELLGQYCECDLLIMDDVGAGQLTAWKVGTTYKIINRRYNANKPTIVTSNLDFDGLKSQLKVKDNDYDGGRIVSRLKDKDNYIPVFFGIEDRRVAK